MYIRNRDAKRQKTTQNTVAHNAFSLREHERGGRCALKIKRMFSYTRRINWQQQRLYSDLFLVALRYDIANILGKTVVVFLVVEQAT